MEQQKTPDTPQEETIFTDQDWSMQGYDKHIKNARIMLFIVAALQFLPLFTLPENITDEAKYIIIGLQVFLLLFSLAWPSGQNTNPLPPSSQLCFFSSASGSWGQ